MDYETPDGSQFSLREVWLDQDGESIFDYTSVSAYVDGSAYVGRLDSRSEEIDEADLLTCLEAVLPECIHPQAPEGVTIAPDFDSTLHYLKAPSFTYDDCRPGRTFVADCVLNEVTVLERLKLHPHPNVVSYLGCVLRDGRITHICLKKYPTSLMAASEQSFKGCLDLGDSWQRLKDSLFKLICMALSAAPDHCLSSREIIDWIDRNVPGYNKEEGNWRGAISAALSIGKERSDNPGTGLWKKIDGDPQQNARCSYQLLSDKEDELLQCDPVHQLIGRILNGIEAGIDHLHDLDLAHNDITPENICLDESGQPIIIDFDGCLPFGKKLMKGTSMVNDPDSGVPLSSKRNDLVTGMMSIQDFLLGPPMELDEQDDENEAA